MKTTTHTYRDEFVSDSRPGTSFVIQINVELCQGDWCTFWRFAPIGIYVDPIVKRHASREAARTWAAAHCGA